MLELFLFILILAAGGYAMRAFGLMEADAAKDLNQLVFHLTLPPLIFLALHDASLAWGMLWMPAIAWVMTGISVAIAWAVARAFRLPPEGAGGLILAMAFANTTYFGYPVIGALYGTHRLTLAIFFDLLGATMAVNTIGTAIASFYGHGTPSFRLVAKRLGLFPPIWALVLGLALHGVPLPGLATTVLQRLAALTVPLIMVAFGLQLDLSRWREDLPLVGLVSVVRLALLPLITLGLTHALRLPYDYQQAATMQTAMPTMFYAFTLALSFGLRVNLVINAIMVSSLLSFATLPLWHYLLGP